MELSKEQLRAIECCKEIYFEWEEGDLPILRQVLRDAWKCGRDLVTPPNKSIQGDTKVKIKKLNMFTLTHHVKTTHPKY